MLLLTQKIMEDYIMLSKLCSSSINKNSKKGPSTSKKNNNIKKNERNNKMKYLLVTIYLILTVSGLILYKYGANKNFEISFANNVFNMKLNILSILGLVCYLFSFLIYMLILPKFNLTYIMPVTSAISYISIFALSVMVLKEAITAHGVIGAVIIVIGIIIMNLK